MSTPTRTEPAQTNVEGLKLCPTMECLGCGHEFTIDSSPSFIYCWSCDQRLAEEAQR